MTSITMPVVVHKRSARTDDSTPTFPPVNGSGPGTVDLIRPGAASLPETMPEKMPEKTADGVSFQAMGKPMPSHSRRNNSSSMAL